MGRQFTLRALLLNITLLAAYLGIVVAIRPDTVFGPLLLVLIAVLGLASMTFAPSKSK